MEPIHLKLDFEDAIHSRKLILASQINFLNTAQKIEHYKSLRKEEYNKRTKLKISLGQAIKSLNTFIREVPKTKMPKVEAIKKPEKIAKRKIEEELKDIKKQLEILNSI